MTPIRVIVYDCEIQKAIRGKNEAAKPGLEYCNGWGDYLGMGISLIAAVDVADGIPRVFMADNLGQFGAWSAGAVLVGHSNDGFDDKLVKAHGLWTAGGSYDLLCKLRKAMGQAERGPGVPGRKVNDCARVNLNGLQKSDTGANAPELYQAGKLGELVDYGVRDVMIEYKLFLKRGSFVDPVTGRVVCLEEPRLA